MIVSHEGGTPYHMDLAELIAEVSSFEPDTSFDALTVVVNQLLLAMPFRQMQVALAPLLSGTSFTLHESFT